MKSLISIVLLLSLVGCSTYQRHLREARNKLAAGQAAEAATLLAPEASEEGKDQVLFMLDYAIALHEAGDLEKSNEILIAADRLAEVKDYISVSREAGSLFLNDSLIQYKAERFESILINAYLALNFTMMGDFENALVECRRLDDKIYKYKHEDESVTKSFYARYLSAMIWEAQGNWDSAYIDYKKAWDIDPSLSYLKKDLVRAAWRSRRYEDLKKWQSQFPSVNLASIKKSYKNEGELVFIYQQGWIPRKYPRAGNYRFAELVPQYSDYSNAYVEVDGKKVSETTALYNVGREAIRTLNADFNYLVAKKIIGVVAKEVLADQIRQKDQALGALAAIAMHAADQADLRQWSTLPNSFQISRLNLSPGDHRVTLWATGPNGKRKLWSGPVTIKKGKKTFLTDRTY